ncbi:alpha/beta hydrolase [Cohnella faecalis]|uniref:Alpha/beta hydrolase n=2 Tax=Cohnella faecalis TaxID=2315694 RepID=A0A398CAQ1_9BACL|nr:alpha/beta hydrolase [Cohnella faecalis]
MKRGEAAEDFPPLSPKACILSSRSGSRMNSTELGHRLIRHYPFASESLLNERGIGIYVPPSYYRDENKRYPVLYMHDGQGVFGPNPFSNSSWNVHRTAEELISEGLMEEIIIVGIDNYGQERLNEFAHPLQSSGIPGAPDIICKGESYERFLIEELKPTIDGLFRTLPDREHTALMGSSMGGLVTYNIGFRNPHIFSKLAVMSPYFVRLDLNTLREIPFYKRYPGVNNLALWLDIGEIEANILVEHVRGVVEELIEQGFVFGQNLMYYEVPALRIPRRIGQPECDRRCCFSSGSRAKQLKPSCTAEKKSD